MTQVRYLVQGLVVPDYDPGYDWPVAVFDSVDEAIRCANAYTSAVREFTGVDHDAWVSRGVRSARGTKADPLVPLDWCHGPREHQYVIWEVPASTLEPIHRFFVVEPVPRRLTSVGSCG